MDELTAQALVAFTTRYCDAWHEKNNSWPLSEELYGVPSPCIISSTDDAVFWQPQPFVGEKNLNAVERAFDIVIQPAVHAFYTTQFAGDMHAQFADEKLTLLQTWSEDDFRRVQENLIGHLVTQKRLKLSPTLLLPHKIMSLTSFRCAICPVKCAKKRWEPVNERCWRPHLRNSSLNLSQFCNPVCPESCERSLTNPVGHCQVISKDLMN